MNKIVNSILVVGSLTLLGGACYKTIDTNVNVVGNTNTSNTNVSNANISGNTNSSTIDTSDWLTYENTEIRMKFLYPENWTFKEILTTGARFLTETEDEITISLKRDTTIAKELKSREDNDSDSGELTSIDYLSIAGYNAARVTYTTWVEVKDVHTSTQVEVGGDLIYIPDIQAFPELEKVIESLVLSDE